MTKQEMIEKMAEMFGKDAIIRKSRLETASEFMDIIQQTHHLVEKNKVEVVEGDEHNRVKGHKDVYKKTLINKEWVL